jgi:hypothetical protein
MSVAALQVIVFSVGIAGAIVASVFHATTAIVLSCILFLAGFAVERRKP